ncbi:MAG TPA: sterol desaturase family protein [Chakrabartia sp.]|jgi:sterol desaturase/sphingolipid hydroxylase (fatty acid hydroxylase superfamily)|nr:sterol desaturase family protein [Chakrabartia sp.]
MPDIIPPHLPNPVDYAVPGFILLILLEMIWARRNAPDKYEPNDTLSSLLFGFGSTVAGALTAGLVLALFNGAYAHRVVTIPFIWWAWIACFVLDDLAYYWFHRAAHRIRWMWASHVNHHSSQHYNLSTALRQTWTGFIALSLIFRLPLMLIGFHPAMVLFVGGINLIYQFWIHTEVIGRFPRFIEAVMNTPSHHRVHHGVNPRYLDTNYAGVFIIWDRMFGTFTPELDEEPVRYGIVKQLGGFNLLWSVFHEWIGIAQDLWRAPWGSKLGYLFGPPGWTHDGSRDTSDSIKARMEAATDPAE